MKNVIYIFRPIPGGAQPTARMHDGRHVKKAFWKNCIPVKNWVSKYYRLMTVGRFLLEIIPGTREKEVGILILRSILMDGAKSKPGQKNSESSLDFGQQLCLSV